MDARISRLLERRKRLLQKLAGLKLMVHGSYLERFSTCARKHCACHQGDRHGPRSYVVIYREAQQRQVYVPQEQVCAVRQGLRQDEQAADVLRRITDINLALMRAGALEGSGDARREGRKR
jgi:hypothetical protein